MDDDNNVENGNYYCTKKLRIIIFNHFRFFVIFNFFINFDFLITLKPKPCPLSPIAQKICSLTFSHVQPTC